MVGYPENSPDDEKYSDTEHRCLRDKQHLQCLNQEFDSCHMAQSQYKQRMFKASVTLVLLSNKLFEIYCVQQSFLWVTTTWGSFPRGALSLGPNTSQLSG